MRPQPWRNRFICCVWKSSHVSGFNIKDYLAGKYTFTKFRTITTSQRAISKEKEILLFLKTSWSSFKYIIRWHRKLLAENYTFVSASKPISAYLSFILSNPFCCLICLQHWFICKVIASGFFCNSWQVFHFFSKCRVQSEWTSPQQRAVRDHIYFLYIKKWEWIFFSRRCNDIPNHWVSLLQSVISPPWWEDWGTLISDRCTGIKDPRQRC